MSVTRIVVTGGPCGDRDAVIDHVGDAIRGLGYTVLTATDLVGGADAESLKRQLDTEAELIREAETVAGEKKLILCDGGALDLKAHVDGAKFAELLRLLDVSEVELRDGYGAVFHFATEADDAESAALDLRILSAWTGHPHLRIIDNSTSHRGKIDRLVEEVFSFLGEPEPLEIERKFLIRYPEREWLESLPCCRRVEISQTYLESPHGERFRVRQRGADGDYVYFKTVKHKVSEVKRIEIETRLSREEYLGLLQGGNTAVGQIIKDRYCLAYDGQYFEIDVFPFWDDRAILEIELLREDSPIRFPEGIGIVKEVTEDKFYRNSSLARKFGKISKHRKKEEN